MFWLVGIVSSELKNKSNTSNQSEVANTTANSTPVPTPAPTPKAFAQLKTEADNLLAIQQSEYETVDVRKFDEVMAPLRAIPKGSKDYKSAQQFNEKLINKAGAILAERMLLGEKPLQSSWDGDVLPVKTYLKAVLNDYDSSEFVEWSPVTKVYIGKEPYWGVRLRLRAKNAFGALMLRDTYYYIRNNQVVIAKGLGGD